MSRTNALKSISHELLKETLERHGVKLLGGGLDEAPQAYKDIEEVMASQRQLVEIVGRFIPKIVKMDGAMGKTWKKRGAAKNYTDGGGPAGYVPNITR